MIKQDIEIIEQLRILAQVYDEMEFDFIHSEPTSYDDVKGEALITLFRILMDTTTQLSDGAYAQYNLLHSICNDCNKDSLTYYTDIITRLKDSLFSAKHAFHNTGDNHV